MKSDEKRKDLVDIKITSDTDSSKDTKTKVNKPSFFYLKIAVKLKYYLIRLEQSKKSEYDAHFSVK